MFPSQSSATSTTWADEGVNIHRNQFTCHPSPLSTFTLPVLCYPGSLPSTPAILEQPTNLYHLIPSVYPQKLSSNVLWIAKVGLSTTQTMQSTATTTQTAPPTYTTTKPSSATRSSSAPASSRAPRTSESLLGHSARILWVGSLVRRFGGKIWGSTRRSSDVEP